MQIVLRLIHIIIYIRPVILIMISNQQYYLYFITNNLDQKYRIIQYIKIIRLTNLLLLITIKTIEKV